MQMRILRNRRVMLSVLGACLLVLVPVACGDGDSDGTSLPATTATSVAPSTSIEPSSSTSAPATTGTTGQASTSTAVAETCSASGLSLGLFPLLGLPDAVAATRQSLFEAASSCDFDGLEALADAAGGIRFTFGEQQGGPAAYWREAEKSGDPVLATLMKILDMPYGRTEGRYVWPWAHALDFSALTDEQLSLLRQYFTEKEIQSYIDFGGYFGYRVGIAEDGTWSYYVAGD